MLFPLKLQRDNRKKALAVDPAEGKTGKKLYFSPYCGDETTLYYDRAFLFGSVIVQGCFVSTIYWKYMLFLYFSAGGLCDWGSLLVISLKLQRNNQ